MNGEGNGAGAPDPELVGRLRRLVASGGRSAEEAEPCDLCGVELAADHRHLLHLEERRILCACEPCIALRAGDGPYRPTGSRLLWLEGFDLPDELWARLRIPIGLAFFMRSPHRPFVVCMRLASKRRTQGCRHETSCVNPQRVEDD